MRADLTNRNRPLFLVVVLIGLLTLSGTALSDEQPLLKQLDTVGVALDVEVLASGLSFPWSLVGLPDGSFLVTEKNPGRLRRVASDGTLGPALDGLPSIRAEQNGGLLGLAVDPAFTETALIYVAFSEPGEGQEAGLSVARGALESTRLDEVEIIFRQRPKVADARNFGGRLAFAPDGTLFVMTGDRFAWHLVQPLDNTIGVVARINRDGTIPTDNPFAGDPSIDPAIWSWGHRNIGGGAFHPETGQLWVAEFGPWGGDELNIAEPGQNLGWPLVSWGNDYSGELIPDPPTRPDLTPSIFHWHPVFGPSGMAFYDKDLIPRWSGDLLIGGLTARRLTRLTLRGDRVIAQEHLLFDERIRDVVVDKDGAVLLLTDEANGKILRLAPSLR